MKITINRLRSLIREALSSDEEAQLNVVKRHAKTDKNPFVYTMRYSSNATSSQIGFWVPRKAEPLWWTGSGFKDLSQGNRSEPQEFESAAEAEAFIESDLLNFIKTWRKDQIHLIWGR